MVYNPLTRRLIRLNLSAWLIFELCAYHRWPILERRYVRAVESKIPLEFARRQLDETLNCLLSEGLVEFIADR
jgi:hypothetical protein